MTIEQIKQNIEYGDYTTLARLLGMKSVQAARMRFLREDPEAVKAMQALQENREQLVREYKTQNQ